MSGMIDRPYLRESQRHNDYLNICNNVFSGKVRLDWIDRYNDKYVVSYRIVKSTRMMLSLRWIHSHFPQIPQIYILRHPLAVVASRMKLADREHDWRASLESLFGQSDLVEDYLQDSLYLSKTTDEFEREVIFWCVLNHVALRQLENTNHCLVYYEDCVQQPKEMFASIMGYITNYSAHFSSIRVSSESIDNIVNWRFTSTSGKSIKERLSAWQHDFTPSQLSYTTGILKEFGLDRHYNVNSIHSPSHKSQPH